MAELKIDPGKMPDWGRSDLPAPPPYTGRNILSVIGPGTIALSMAIGSGEWLMGPSAAALYGPTILWVTTVAVILQVIFNQECARYIMYTGETAFSGFMRTSPGPRFWGWVYCILGVLQIGWPGWAAASAATIFAAIVGKLPGGADRGAYAGMGICQLCRRYFRPALRRDHRTGAGKNIHLHRPVDRSFSCWLSISSSCPGERGGKYSPGSSSLA